MKFRLHPSPSIVIAGMALLFALGGSAFALGQKTVPQPRCQTGAVRAIAVVTGVPAKGIENLPDTYTNDPQAFGRRFNCTGKGVEVKRAQSLKGAWDVRFPGISGASCLASSMSPDAGSVSCVPQPDGSYRVSLRGVATDAGVLLPQNVPFLVVIF
jgi:hypothetical protein